MKVFLSTIATFITIGFALSTEPECPKDNTLLANVEDCSSYWVCQSGYPILEVCPYGTLFDAIKLSCEDYEMAVCQGKRPPRPPATEIPPFPPTSGNPSSTVRPPTTVRPSTTLKPSTTIRPSTTLNSQTTVRHSTSARPSTSVRPSSTVRYSTTLRYSTTVRHSTSTRPSTSVRPSSTVRYSTLRPSTVKLTTEKPASTTQSLPEEYPVHCPPQLGPDDNFLLPNPKDLHTFYHCAYGIPYLKKCQVTLLFNPKKLACDWPRNVCKIVHCPEDYSKM